MTVGMTRFLMNNFMVAFLAVGIVAGTPDVYRRPISGTCRYLCFPRKLKNRYELTTPAQPITAKTFCFLKMFVKPLKEMKTEVMYPIELL